MWWRSDVIKRYLWHVRRLTCNNSMAYLKNWTDNFFQIFFMGTSWVAVSINNITTRASREMTSRKNIKIFDFNGVNVAKHWYVAGEVFAISDCLVAIAFAIINVTLRGNNLCDKLTYWYYPLLIFDDHKNMISKYIYYWSHTSRKQRVWQAYHLSDTNS